MNQDDIRNASAESLQALSTQINSEIERRKKEEAAASLRRFQEWCQKISSIEIVDIIAPEHGRTSCNDDNRNNGLCSINEDIGRTAPRCVRCALLDFLHDGGYWGEEPVHLTHTLGPR